MSITVAKFKDVSQGTQPGQFTVGDREPVTSLADLEPSFKRLLDEPVTAVVAVVGRADQPHLTPVWFDYEGDTVLLNLATHRKKVDWLRKAPYATFLLMNPENTYHWISIKTVVKREISEDDPAEGQRVTDQLDRIWTKYTGNEPPTGCVTLPSTSGACCSRWRSSASPPSAAPDVPPAKQQGHGAGRSAAGVQDAQGRRRRRVGGRAHRGPGAPGRRL